MKRMLLFIPILLSLLLSSCKKEIDPIEERMSNEYIVYPDGSESKNDSPLITTNVKDGKEITILPSEWMAYYKESDDYMSIRYSYTEGEEDVTPNPLTIVWDSKEQPTQYNFKISTNRKMENPVEYTLDSNTIQLTDLYAGTHYYYQIHAVFIDKTVVSKRFDFKTVDFFRTIKIDGVYNGRDLGNKKTFDGKKVFKQGLVYRTANFDSVTSTGKLDAINKYGIKTDLDLREREYGDVSPLSEQVQYINNGGDNKYGSPHYTSSDYGLKNELYQAVMKENLKVFADNNNFPVAFHCAVGRDRTGTLAIVLLLLCEIDLLQIRQDYVVSYFSKACNNTSLDDYVNQMESTLKYFTYYRSKAGDNSGNIYHRAENYCLDIGLTQADINSIRSNLLEAR